MPYNPAVHHRRSIRMKGYDYTQPGAYFITICTHRREWLFGHVRHGEMQLSPLGCVVAARWQALPRTFRVRLDEWVVMPNHVHGIIWIVQGETASSAGAGAAAPQTRVGNDGRPRGPARGSVGAIVGNLKSVSTRRSNRIRRTPGARLWQRGYWEHIVRDKWALRRIRAYIRNNPRRWERDRNRRRPKRPSRRSLGLRLCHVREE